jgi:hypothetical protein
VRPPLTIAALGYPTLLLAKTCRRGQELSLEVQLQLQANELTYIVIGPFPLDSQFFAELQPALDCYNRHEALMEDDNTPRKRD